MTKEERKIYMKEYRKRNIEKIKENDRKYREEHKDKRKEYIEKNKEKIAEQTKQYQILHKEHYADIRKKSYNEHKEEKLQYAKKYRDSHKEQMKAFMVIYRKEHAIELREYTRIRTNYLYHTDMRYHLLSHLRGRLGSYIKNKSEGYRTKQLLGCSLNTLLLYLEKQFTEGMTWDNYGEWHMDHILPCARFDFNNLPHQRVCFNYRNLQPLWCYENQIKSSFLIGDWQKKLYEICFALGIGPRQILDTGNFPIEECVCM